jgi:hypothetical protein
MSLITFLRSPLGRVLRVAVGIALIGYGTVHPSLAGLVLMLVGIVPAVTGAAGICLLEELMQALRGQRPHPPLGGSHVRSDHR